MIDTWKALDKEIVIDNKWLSVSKVTFELPNGRVVRDYYIAKRTDIVLIVPLHDGKTILMREFERGVMDFGYKVPAGGVEPSEDPGQAARREFLEETGYEIGNLQKAGILHADPGWITTKVHVYVARDLKRVSDPKPDGTEHFESSWLPIEEVEEMVKQGKISNMFAVAALSLTRQFIV